MLKSTFAITTELDDIDAGSSQLAEETLNNLELQGSSLGLLLCDSDVDHEKFAKSLHRKLGIPIVGFSSTAMICGREGLIDMSAVLTTVTSDDVFFSVAASEPLTPDNAVSQIELTYKKALASLKGEPALVLAFPPYILGIMLDVYPRELNRISGEIPVFGGLPAHDEVNGRTAVYCGDTAASDRLAVVLASGAIKPVMTVKNHIGTLISGLKRTVTRSEGNVVHRVENGTFVEFIEEFGLDASKLANPDDKSTSFTTYPLLVEKPDIVNPDGIPIVRTLHGIDLRSGTGTAIGEIPEGSALSIGVLQAQDIAISTRNSIEDLLALMRQNEADGYKYSLVFAVSCVARYYVMAGKSTLEADALMANLPSDLSLCGYYSFGEICPTSVRSGRALNAAHNESLVLLAL
ncbi:MAG: FIST C-terminal domain-containing protein [Synergistaceae bacterium]|nr:FIST C-terminal domain-containing protein [Synergistaceae bacterium]